MTDTTQPGPSKAPTHTAYQVRDRAGAKGFWTRVGVAWTNRDGGFTVQLDALPLDGRVVCQPADKKPAE